MGEPTEAPRQADMAGPLSDVRLLGDIATAIVGDSIALGASLLRTGSRLPGLRSQAVWRPPFVPSRLQPASLLAAGARRGKEHRARTIRYIERLLDAWTPLIAEALVSRLDLDAIVARVDIAVLVEEVLAEVDLPALIRESTGSVASESVRGARMTGISADEAISRALERHLFRRRSRAPSIGDPS